jgi:hypothetical protein
MRSALLVLLTLASIVAGGEVQLSGREAEAVQEATRIFKSKQGSKIEWLSGLRRLGSLHRQPHSQGRAA